MPVTYTGAAVDAATESKQVEGNTLLQGIADVAASEAPAKTAPDSSTIFNGSTALTPKFAKVDLSTSGDLVAAVSGKKIRVLSMFVLAAGDVTFKIQSDASVDRTGAMALAAKGGFVLPPNDRGWFETDAGKKLNAVLSGAVNVAGGLTYIEV